MKTWKLIFLYAICSMALTGAARADTSVNRNEVFLLNDEKLDTKGNWKGLFCVKDNPLNCELIETPVQESRSSSEVLPDGKKVRVLVYKEQPARYPKFFVKGLDARTGPVHVEKMFDSTSAFPLSFTWKNEKYSLEPKMPRLMIKSDYRSAAQQWIDIFDDKGICKNGEQMSDVYLKIWIGDLDGDGWPDFYIYASAPHASCWPNRSQKILILSNGPTNGIGKVYFGRYK